MITVAGSALVDIFTYSEKLPRKHETVSGSRYVMTPGGKGANQASSAARLGGNVYFLGRFADKNDIMNKKIIDGFNWANINYENCFFDEKLQCGIATLMVDKESANQITIVVGSSNEFLPGDIDQKIEIIKKSDIVLTEFGIPLETCEYVCKKAKENDALTIVTPGPAYPINDSFCKDIDILVPNEIEIEQLTGYDIGDCNVEKIKKACKTLIKRGINNIIVTLGKNGSFLYTEDRQEFIPAVIVEPVDSVGAGDSYCGALAFCLDKNMNLYDAARFATVAAASSVLKSGSFVSMSNMEEVNYFMKDKGFSLGFKL